MSWADQPRDVCGRFTSRPIKKATYILTDKERDRGYVRPVRQTYTHKKCGKDTMLAIALAQGFAGDLSFLREAYCTTCGKHFPVSDFLWEETEEEVGS